MDADDAPVDRSNRQALEHPPGDRLATCPSSLLWAGLRETLAPGAARQAFDAAATAALQA